MMALQCVLRARRVWQVGPSSWLGRWKQRPRQVKKHVQEHTAGRGPPTRLQNAASPSLCRDMSPVSSPLSRLRGRKRTSVIR